MIDAAMEIARQPRTAPLVLAGEAVSLDPAGVLWLPARECLIVSDLHLEKGSSYARRGIHLPPYDTAATLSRLRAAIMRLAPRRVVALGDSFHDRGAAARLSTEDRSRLASLMAGREWLWITGNHDPEPPADLGGHVADRLQIGALTLIHEPSAGPAPGEIAGHLHPVGSIRVRGRRVRRRCFAADGTRLIMPAFGAYAGGLCVLDAAFEPLFGPAFQAHLLGKERIYTIPPDKLVPDDFGAAPVLRA